MQPGMGPSQPMQPGMAPSQPMQAAYPVDPRGVPMDPRQQCCFGSKHIMEGAKIVGYVELILCVIVVISSIVNLATGLINYDTIVGLISSVLTAIAINFLFQGLQERNAGKLLPYLIIMGISIALYCIGVLLVIVCLAGGMNICYPKRKLGGFYADEPAAHPLPLE